MELGISKGSFLEPLIFLIYIADIPETNTFSITLFAEDVAVLLINDSLQVASKNANSSKSTKK